MSLAVATENKRADQGFFAIGEILAEDLKAFETFLADQRLVFEEEIQDLVAYCLAHRGKRIRPVLVFLAGGRATAREPISPMLVKAAAVVEMVHLATLIHDDILDEAQLRHQTPTIFQKHGSQIAVLLGDAFFAQALHLASVFPTVEVCRAVSQATRRVCSGEMEQNFQKGKPSLSEEHYLRIIDLKTAELFRVSCRLGGLVSGATTEQTAALEEFGRQLGIGYQMYDDLLDVFGRESHSGKTLGTDFQSGKWTLPMILFAEQLSTEERTEWVGQWSAGKLKLDEVRLRLVREGIHQLCLAKMEERVKAARAPLESLPETLRNSLSPLTETLENQVVRLLSLSD